MDWDEMIDIMVDNLEFETEGKFRKHSFMELDIIKHLVNVPKLCDRFHSWLRSLPNVRADGEEKSNQFRARANTMFKGDGINCPSMFHQRLAEVYSNAIFAAPGGSRALALAHANRAVVLIRLRWYREAFDDCQLALDGDYPEESRLKVLFRQAECAEQMAEAGKLGPIIEALARIASTKGLRKAEEQRLEKLREMYDAANKREVEKTIPTNDVQYQAALKEKEAPPVGRYVVAEKPIQANDVIATETAVSFVPVYDPENRTTLPSFDCQKCAKVNVVPFPCPMCGRACYCSTLCRMSHVPVHRFECFGYRKHLWYRIGIAHLGVRSFLDGFDMIRGEIAKAKDASACFEHLMEATREEDNRFADYGRVLRLVTNFDKMKHTDRLRYALAGLMLAVYLHECTPFAEEAKKMDCTMSPSELLVCCGALITRHIGQLVCNGHAISELRGTLPSKFDCFQVITGALMAGMLHMYFKSDRVFTGIFPRISMFNHSCDPNIRNHFDRTTLTVHATRPIGAGCEIFNCYGPNYRLMPTKERQMMLRAQYCFDCRCERCRDGDTYAQRFNMIRCLACRKEYAMELDVDMLRARKPWFCVYCYEKIPTITFERIFELDLRDREYDGDLPFQRIETLYERGNIILLKSNQMRAIVLRHILDYYTKFCHSSSYLWSSLLNLALEYALLMRERFGYMSLEFLTGCFYLLDVWAIFCLCGGDEPHEMEKEEERTVLKQFREALGMIGADNRETILDFMRRYKIIDVEEEPEMIDTARQAVE